jgi:hypothetical protein
MRIKRFSLLLLALVFIASLAVVGCGGGSATFAVSNLVISPSTTDAGSAVTISALVTNSGGASGTYKAKLNVAGAEVSNQSVEVGAGASATVTFSYTPSVSSTFTVSIGDQSGSLVVSESTGYWDIKYQAVEGSYIVLNYSVASATSTRKVVTFNESNGINLIMQVNKSDVNGMREVRIPAATFVFPLFNVPEIMSGLDMDLLMPLAGDAVGVLYVKDGVGDVDMHSESDSTKNPIQDNTQGDGTMDPAGSMVIPITLVGDFDTSIGQKGTLPFGLIFTTGHIDNVVHITTNKKFDGSILASEGVPFAKDGGVAPYVGTAGTITTTGTGGCLGIKLVGFRIDFQAEIKLVLEPLD